MKLTYILSFSLLCVSVLLQAAPSMRPLPPGVIDSTDDYQVLRDHVKERLFYLIPKRYRVLENSLQSFGDQSEGCKSVGEYNNTVRVIIEAKRNHALISLKRAELVTKMLTQVADLKTQISDLVLEKLKIENELEMGAETLPENEIKKRKERIEKIEKYITEFTANIQSIEKIQKNAETEQGQILNQIKSIEETLNTFEPTVIKPVAKLSVRLALPESFIDNKDFNKSLGLSEGDALVFPKLASLSLFPLNSDHLDFRERSERSSSIGGFQPEWNVQPLELTEAYFGTSSLNSSIEWRQLPQAVAYEQIISLYTYCAIREGRKPEKEFFAPLQIGFHIAEWVDKTSSSGIETNLINFRTSLKAELWDRLVWTGAAGESDSGGLGLRVDVGSPEHFSKTEGVYQPRAYSVLFDFAPLNEERKKQ